MTEPAPLTTNDVKRLLAQLGCTGEGDAPAHCPMCKTARLTITANGAGPHLTCSNGCDHIDAYLQTVAVMPMPRGPHVDKLAVLRDKLGLPELERIVKIGTQGSAYELHLHGRDEPVELGPIGNIISQPKFRAAFLPQVRRNPPVRYKADVWDQIAELIEQAAEEHGIATEHEEMIGWLLAYLPTTALESHRGVDMAQPAMLFAQLKSTAPAFVDMEHCLHLRLQPFIQWLGRMTGVRVTLRELSGRLSAMGFERQQHAARNGTDTRNGRYWRSPQGFEETLW